MTPSVNRDQRRRAVQARSPRGDTTIQIFSPAEGRRVDSIGHATRATPPVLPVRSSAGEESFQPLSFSPVGGCPVLPPLLSRIGRQAAIVKRPSAGGEPLTKSTPRCLGSTIGTRNRGGGRQRTVHPAGCRPSAAVHVYE